MFSSGVWRDDRLTSPFGEPIAKFAGIVGTVREQAFWRGNAGQQGCRPDKVMGLTGRERERERPAHLVGYGVNLGRPSAARSSDRLFEVPPFAPEAERWALTCVESTDVVLTTPLEPLSA